MKICADIKHIYKNCSICKKEFPVTREYFYYEKRASSGFSGRCIKCAKKKDKEYREKRREQWLIYRKTYRKKNKEKVSLWAHNNYLKNKETVKKRVKKYAGVNKETIKKRAKKYRNENKQELNRKKREYRALNKDKINQRYAEDGIFRMKARLRSRLRKALNLYSETGKIMKSKDYFIDYNKIIDKLGPCPGKKENWHIDHIIPLFAFDLSDLCEVWAAFHPENHKWITKEANLKKSASYNKEDYLAYMLNKRKEYSLVIGEYYAQS